MATIDAATALAACEDCLRQIKVADERLALAGLRLAALLNEILGHMSPREFRH